MKFLLNTQACGVASAAVTGIVYILCILAFTIIPDIAYKIGNSLFHGIEMTNKIQITLGSALWGFIFWFILSYAGGFIFAVLYNMYVEKEQKKK